MSNEQLKKPPAVIVPRSIHVMGRIRELTLKIQEYAEHCHPLGGERPAGGEVEEWIEELGDRWDEILKMWEKKEQAR